MKQPIISIVLGVLVIIMGLRDNEYKMIPQVLYYVFGAILILFGVYKLFANATVDNKD
jgi:sulfite exporter TauE/SafE